MTSPTLSTYRLRQRAMVDLSPVLAALASVDDLDGSLMHSIGVNAANASFQFGDIKSMSGLAGKLATSFADHNWGVVSISEESDHIAIRIDDYPAIQSEFGQAELYICRFFEGYFSGVFARLSQHDGLAVSVAKLPTSTNEPLLYRFGPA